MPNNQKSIDAMIENASEKEQIFMAISAISATTQRLSDITTKMIDRFDELTKRIEALEGKE